MDLEDYLVESESSIIAINCISKFLMNYFMNYYGSFLKGETDKRKLDEMVALCKVLQMISYCMRLEHNDAYKTISEYHRDDFSYDYAMKEGIII